MYRFILSYRNLLLAFCILILPIETILGQNASNNLDDFQRSQLEEIIENLDGSEDFDFNTIYEELAALLKHPLNINEAEEEAFRSLLVLNDVQINDLLVYRSEYGPIIALEELQVIPSFDLKTIKNIVPFLSTSYSENYHVPIADLFKNGESTLYLKWRSIMETEKGYIPNDEGNAAFEGDKNRFYLRYRHEYENKFRMGLTAEKDSGEKFFGGSNKTGFDFYSAHIYLKDYNSYLKDAVIGDFSISMGQGLIAHNGFGTNKSAQVLSIKKDGRVVKPYSSVNETNYFRGAAASFKINTNIELSLFGSGRHLDGNLVVNDTIVDTGFETFSSISQSGFHRTNSEIEKENSVSWFSTGGQVRFKKNNFYLNANGVYHKFGVAFDRSYNIADQFKFSGDHFLNLSVDYGYRFKNFNVFGETARSNNGGLATLNGLLVNLDKKVDFSVLYRNYQVKYQTLQPNAFGETFGANNEVGLYTSMIVRPSKLWTISAYADFFRHPWLDFRKDAPSRGSEFLIRANYYLKRKYNFYVQYKYETKELNTRPIDSKFNILNTTNLHRLRLQFDNKVNKSLELRNRIELSYFENEDENHRGFLMYQDVIYKSISSPLSLTARFSIFDIQDFNTRIYTYENDLIYEFFIPFYQNRGLRYYLNMRYNWNHNLMTEFRIAQTYYDNVENISSGNTLILGRRKTELKAQIKYNF